MDSIVFYGGAKSWSALYPNSSNLAFKKLNNMDAFDISVIFYFFNKVD